jgi:hypothetical protein
MVDYENVTVKQGILIQKLIKDSQYKGEKINKLMHDLKFTRKLLKISNEMNDLQVSHGKRAK